MADESRTEDTWNVGGTGNATGEELATPSTTWNPGGTGNATDVETTGSDVSTGTTTGATEAERHGSTQQEPADTEDSDGWQSRGQQDTGL